LPIIQLYGNLHIQDERQQEIHKQREWWEENTSDEIKSEDKVVMLSI
jgi:hypothetical protein